ncbi:uncharacterized protein VTP21DRAFT_7860 [Calcarisporiella thermophila]|uniref:uncharacterized protein n=1 Tax=Calcarisporiella thermophila TaxID=911321 RepID=UPI0037432B9F
MLLLFQSGIFRPIFGKNYIVESVDHKHSLFLYSFCKAEHGPSGRVVLIAHSEYMYEIYYSFEFFYTDRMGGQGEYSDGMELDEI